jgi:hypothetical protein
MPRAPRMAGRAVEGGEEPVPGGVDLPPAQPGQLLAPAGDAGQEGPATGGLPAGQPAVEYRPRSQPTTLTPLPDRSGTPEPTARAD